nr:MAG TPA: hypothetical protein [Caudoviricetes sp.]
MKTVKVPLSQRGIDTLLREIESYTVWLKERSQVLLDRLAQAGFEVASARFSKAVYDGTNDASVSLETRSEGVRAVVAVGASVLFIEFGTGVTYPDNHPQAAELGMKRGEYGKGHGKQSSWGYYGDPGTNGVVKMKKDGSTVVITHGNPANMPMYETVKELEAMLPELVKEVFS